MGVLVLFCELAKLLKLFEQGFDVISFVLGMLTSQVGILMVY